MDHAVGAFNVSRRDIDRAVQLNSTGGTDFDGSALEGINQTSCCDCRCQSFESNCRYCVSTISCIKFFVI
jgi:hypothetical protein